MRWIIGLTFVYAAIHKILSPADFAKIVYGYGIFPDNLINLIAIIVPFIELLSGVALLLGIYTRSAILIINTMLIAFILILSYNLIRGHEFVCGCFSFKEGGLFASTEVTIARDVTYLIMGIIILFFRGHPIGRLPLFRND